MSIDETDIEELAKAPRKVETEEGTVVERGIKEVIEADRYLKAKSLEDKPLHGLRVSRCKPGGPV